MQDIFLILISLGYQFSYDTKSYIVDSFEVGISIKADTELYQEQGERKVSMKKKKKSEKNPISI